MKSAFTNDRLLLQFTFLCYTLFLCGLIFSVRALSSISTGLLLISGLFVATKQDWLKKQDKNEMLFLASCILFFVLQFISLTYAKDLAAGWKNIQLKSGLLFIPLATLLTTKHRILIQEKLFRVYILLLLFASVYCLAIAIRNYSNNQSSAVFFYHDLVKPIEQHAVYFSIYVVAAIIIILESARKGNSLFSVYFNVIIPVFLSLFLFLLASRFIIAFYLVYLFVYFIGFAKKKKTKNGIKIIVLVTASVIISFLLSGKNEVARRYGDLLNGSIEVLNQEKYKTSDYFNGIQFRLIQWKLVTEILNEKRSWWAGVSAADAQTLLNEKYIKKSMYTGDPVRGDTGFLNYNTHNQLLESLLQNGLTGLLAWLLIIFCLLKLAIQNGERAQIFTTIIVVAYSTIESVFETQYGILLFTFLPLFIYVKEPGNKITRQPITKEAAMPVVVAT